MKFSELLKIYGITMTDLSRRYEIPYRTVQDWHAGRREPPAYVLNLLRRCLDADAAQVD